MANLKEVRNRIASVNSTQQITKAMKMVSAAKLRRAQDAILTMRPYAAKLREIMENISGTLEGGAGEPVIATIAGAPARVVSQTDTAIVLAVTNPDLVAAGVSVGEIAVIQLLMHYGLATATMGAVAA